MNEFVKTMDDIKVEESVKEWLVHNIPDMQAYFNIIYNKAANNILIVSNVIPSNNIVSTLCRLYDILQQGIGKYHTISFRDRDAIIIEDINDPLLFLGMLRICSQI